MGRKADDLGNAGYDDLTVDDTTINDPFAVEPGFTPESTYSTGGIAGAEYSDVVVEAYPADMGSDDEVTATREQIEQTRSDMSQTIDAIQDKLSPSNLVQDAKDATIGKAQDAVSSAGETAVGFGSSVVDLIKQNPIPAALASVGIGWLIVSGRNSSSQRNTTRTYPRNQYGPRYNYSPAYDVPYQRSAQYGPVNRYQTTGSAGSEPGGLSGATQQAADSVSGAVNQAQNVAGQAVNQVQDTANQAVNQVQDTASQLAGQAQYGMQQAQSGVQQMMTQNPLAVAAGALALGLAVGLAIPETPQENEFMGPVRDQLVDQAQQTVQEKAQQVQQAAQQAVGAAQDAAESAINQQSKSQSTEQSKTQTTQQANK